MATVTGSKKQNIEIEDVTGLQSDLDSKLESETVTSISVVGNELKYIDEAGTTTTIDLANYLDDTNLARITRGTYDSNTQSLVFTRDDDSTFSIDASMFFDDTNLVTSVAGKTGAVSLSKSDVGLGNVDNTADSVKTVAKADKLTTARTLSLSGDASGSVSFDGSANATLSVSVADDSHTHDGRYYTEAESDSRFVNVAGDTISGDLAVNGTITLADTYSSGEVRFPESQVINRRFEMVENVSPQYILLCGNAVNNDVNGTVTMDRTSGNWQACWLQVIVSSGSTPTPRGSIIHHGVVQNNEEYTLVTVTYAGQSYVAIKYTGNAYPETTGAWFSGRIVSTLGSSLTVVAATDITNEAALLLNSKYEINGQSVFHEGYHPNADKWTTARTLSLTGDVTGSTTWDGSGNASITATVANDSHSHTPESIGAAKFVNNATLNNSTTTDDFITELTNEFGCFNDSQVTLKCAWSYSSNSDLVTGHPTIGTIELAGCTIETWGGTYKHVRITRPNTGTGEQGVYEYNDQGSGYSPGWREIWTSGSDGSGSGLDADLLDGLQGSQYAKASQVLTDVPAGAKFTDTWRGISDSVTSSNSFTSASSNAVRIAYNKGAEALVNSNSKLDMSGTAVNSHKLGDLAKEEFSLVHARFNNTGNENSRLKITLPFSTSSDKMLKFTISAYSGYMQDTYEVAGYLYPSHDQWYLPTVVYSGTSSPDILVGRDAFGNAYVSIAARSYVGCSVFNLTVGYNGAVSDAYKQGWTIEKSTYTANSVTPSVSKVWHSTNDGPGSGLDADLLDGLHASSFARTSGTYSGLRAQATTKDDVGLGNVPNWSSGTFDGRYLGKTANAVSASKWTTSRTLSLTGDVTGSVSWDGSANASITTVVANDSHTHDGRYYTIGQSDNRFMQSKELHNRFYVNLGGVGTRWYKIGHHPNTNGFVQIQGTIGSHVESFGTSKFDLTLFVREGNSGAQVSIDGTFSVAHQGTGVRVIRAENDGGYEGYEIWLKTPNYAQCCVDVNSIGLTYDGASYVTFEPTGFETEIDTSGYNQGHYIVEASSVQQTFRDNYHPNADKWTTARTISLAGDASGSVSIDGSSNRTLTVAVANDSHTHDGRYYTESESDARFVNVTGDTMTGNLGMNNNKIVGLGAIVLNNREGSDFGTVSGTLMFDENFYSDAEYGATWSGSNGGGISIYNEDGWGRVLTDRNAQWHTATFGGLKVGSNTVFHDGYHPNADKWTTARTHTVTLTGDVTGSASATVDGTGNWTNTITAVVANDSHTHDGRYYTESEADSRFVNATGDTMTGALTLSGATDLNFLAGSNEDAGDIVWKYSNGTEKHRIWDGGTGLNYRYNGGPSQRIYHQAYHPEADKWTTARTLSLTGDVTGSVSIDGSANASITATVANDSHTHDGRYYTESEVQTYMDRGYINRHSATNLAVGWYTIATNTGDRASARFGIWDTNSGDHQSVTFYASHHFGTDSSNTLTVLDNSYFSGNPFRYIRIKDAGTYDGAALQIYIDDSTNAVGCAILGDNFQSSGWTLCDWIPDATTPPNVSNYGNFGERSKVDLNTIAQGGFATTGEIYAGGDTSQHRVFHNNYHPNADKWTTARTLSLTGDVTGSVSVDGSGDVSMTTVVGNNTHTHNRLYEHPTIDYGWSGLTFSDHSGNGGSGGDGQNPANPINNWCYHLTMNHANNAGYYMDIVGAFHSDQLWFKRVHNGTHGSFQQIYHDGYHPTADWADQVDVNTSTSTSSYNLLWHSGDTVYGANGKLKFTPSDGTLTFVGGSHTGATIRALDGGVNGTNLVVSTGGNAVFGAGESTGANAVAAGNTSENLHLGADGTAYIYSNAQTWSSRKTFTFATDGDFSAPGTVTGSDCIATSDRRVKTNLVRIKSALDNIDRITGYTFNRKDMDNRRHGGTIAQDWNQVMPEAVLEVEDPKLGKKLTVSAQAQIGFLVECIKELKAELEELKNG